MFPDLDEYPSCYQVVSRFPWLCNKKFMIVTISIENPLGSEQFVPDTNLKHMHNEGVTKLSHICQY